MGLAARDGAIRLGRARHRMGAVSSRRSPGSQETCRRRVPALPQNPQHGRVRLRPRMGRRGGARRACATSPRFSSACRSRRTRGVDFSPRRAPIAPALINLLGLALTSICEDNKLSSRARKLLRALTRRPRSRRSDSWNGSAISTIGTTPASRPSTITSTASSTSGAPRSATSAPRWTNKACTSA